MRHQSLALVLLLLVLPGLILFSACSAPNPVSGARAAIIDQLSLVQPNQAFIDEVTTKLEASGFKVDIYRGEEVSINFYRELPRYGYKLIIFRAHSGLLEEREDSQLVAKEAIYLLSGETYSPTKYVREQLTDQMLKAKMTEDYPAVFAINANFLLNSMQGTFANTVIIMMGCSTTYRPDMLLAFIQKGASTYLGWKASVGLNYVDDATLKLITNLTDKGMPIDQAVRATMAEVGAYPDTNAHLQYYPAGSGSHTIKELIAGLE